MLLNFRKYGEGLPLFVLHGVFGSSDNWQTVGKELSDSHTVYLIDQRNHGESPHSDEMNYDVMATDIKELMTAENLTSIDLLGHSMGGKTAMHFATRFPNLVRKLIVVDISPRHYPPHHQQIFDGFHSIDLARLSSRKEADELMAKVIQDFGVRQFILKSLTRSNGGFEWKINLSVLEKNIERVGEALPESAKYDGEVLFIGGSKSDYIKDDDHQLIKLHFPNASIEIIDRAGHWVHAEKPKQLVELVNSFLTTRS